MAKNTTSSTAPEKTTPASFEEALHELESIVAAMEKGDLNLDPSLDAYQRGMELLKFCQNKLTAAENKIRVFDQGTLSDVNLGATDLPDVD